MIGLVSSEFIQLTSENIQESLAYNITKDFVFPFILALIGALAAWFVFFKQIVNDKKNEKKAKKEDIKNKLTYFSMIVNNAIENSKGQNENISLLITEITNSGINFVSLPKHPTYDLKIISEKIDIEDYFLSYLKFYSKKNKMSNLNEFKEIIDSCGIINDIFIQITNDLESKQKLEFKLKDDYFKNMDNWCDFFGQSLVYLNENKDPLLIELLQVNNNSETIKYISPNKIIKAQYEKLLIPTIKILDKAHSQQKEFDENLGNLWVLTSQTINIYNNLEGAAFQIKTMLVEQNNFVDEQISLLEKASLKIRKDFFKE